ncbi:MAG: FUSC family membrane protein, partial [Ferruginibacter sp.]
MKLKKVYKNFINGRFLNEGLRITAGIVLPSLLLASFNLLSVGLVMSIAALCMSIADSPGAVKHRRNGMIVCMVLICLITLLVHLSFASKVLLGFLITLSGFIFSMLTVYGARSSSIGIAVLIVLVLNLEIPLKGEEIWLNTAYTFAGSCWYMAYSLLLYRLRPYKIIQQVLGDFIIGISSYLYSRSYFYGKDPQYEEINKILLEKQVQVDANQTILSELLFKTRTIVKESTHTSRVLLKIYLDTADLFESVMTIYQQYSILHEQFDETGILAEYQQLISSLSEELYEVGLAIKSGKTSVVQTDYKSQVAAAKEHFEMLRQTYMKGEKVDDFISLGRILNNLQDMEKRITELHHFTSYDKKIKRHSTASAHFDNYTASEDLRPSIFFNNLNFRSNIFRYSLRVSLALLAGFIISLFFTIGHSYWILLTIVVILKPAYSLTRQRNKDRLIGTFLGAVIGFAVLFVVHDKTALLFLMIGFMTGSYVFLRTNYFVAVLFMTPELLIFFQLLSPGSLMSVLSDRVIDTAIGSMIAFLSNLFLVPTWERTSIRNYMKGMVLANEAYFTLIATCFTTEIKPDIEKIKSVRTNVLIALANLSDSFSRMLSEPRRYQEGINAIHRFVVLNHTLTSHIATLSYYLNVKENEFRSQALLAVIENNRLQLQNTINYLEK